MQNLTQEQFDNQFNVIEDPEGDTVRPDCPAGQENSKHLWTIVDGDDGSMYALSGWHYVNRVGYIITTEPWTEETEAVWFEGAEDEDEEDEDDEDGLPGDES